MRNFKVIAEFIFIFTISVSYAQNLSWPVLKAFDPMHTSQIAFPIGGIGTGTISMAGNGEFIDWEIVNRGAIGFKPSPSFVALYAKADGEPSVTRVLEGPLPLKYYVGKQGATADIPGLPRFRTHSFAAAYPFGQVFLNDSAVPLSVTIQAFNPLVPGDVKASSYPIAVLRYVLKNKTNKKVNASLCFNLQNFIGTDGMFGKVSKNKNVFQQNDLFKGIFMTTEGLDPCDERFGTIALTTKSSNTTSFRTSWIKNALWFQIHILDFWEDFSKDGILEERETDGQEGPIGSLAIQTVVAPKDSVVLEYYLTWHFPNRQKMTWDAAQFPLDCENKLSRVGNYYTTLYKDAWEVARMVIPQLKSLEERSLSFTRHFLESTIPVPIKEAALSNVCNLRSQTVMRAEDGNMFGYEGYEEDHGSWPGSCTHVWNYEQVTPFLFGELAKTMRKVEYAHATDSTGLMSFRVTQPLKNGAEYKQAAADGQMGCLMKLYRDWQLSHDDMMLKKLWPQAKKTLEFAWTPGGWDANQDGVMEGCQHNTMDVDYFGPNPQMGTWYLGALKATSIMAAYLGEKKLSIKCTMLFNQGKKWMDRNLFNGEYYEQHIMIPKDFTKVRNELMVHKNLYNSELPDYQLGEGCLVDQLVGQYMAHICGLGYVLDSTHVIKTLQSIMKYNFKPMAAHFNNMRGYAMGDEEGLLMATYPKGTKMKFPFPYVNEVMTGFEYSTASHMIYEGMVPEGVKCFEAVRDRFDGKKRNPFDEMEAGFHYARAMASWAGILAYSGFQYSEVDKSLQVNAIEGINIWTNGYGWGTFEVKKTDKNHWNITINVMEGVMNIQKLSVRNKGILKTKTPISILKGGSYIFKL